MKTIVKTPEVRNCPDCNSTTEQNHDENCDVQRCSVCHSQRLSCECEGHDPQKTRWTGDWPNRKECIEKGWFAQSGHESDPRWGSYCPCGPDDPGAVPDLNRYLWWLDTGKDDMYDGCDRKPRKS